MIVDLPEDMRHGFDKMGHDVRLSPSHAIDNREITTQYFSRNYYKALHHAFPPPPQFSNRNLVKRRGSCQNVMCGSVEIGHTRKFGGERVILTN
jgi:hypothetical protein